MGKNLGGATQSEFEKRIAKLGKAAFLYELVDAAEVRGRTGKAGFARPQPSDFLLTYKGRTAYVEVKGCENKTSFPLSNIRNVQHNAAKMVIAAGGEYLVFIKRLSEGIWYCVPYQTLHALSGEAKSVKWESLAPFIWDTKDGASTLQH